MGAGDSELAADCVRRGSQLLAVPVATAVPGPQLTLAVRTVSLEHPASLRRGSRFLLCDRAALLARASFLPFARARCAARSRGRCDLGKLNSGRSRARRLDASVNGY